MSRRAASSLQTQILILVGSVVIVLMIGFSFALLYNWQKMLISSECQNALAFTRAFSVAVRDAMIQKENNLLPTEGYLENYVANFKSADPRIRFIAIYDSNLRLLAVTGGAEDLRNLPPVSLVNHQPVTSVYKNTLFGWIVETDYPIMTANKHWGTVQLALETESIRDQMRKNFLYLIILTALFTLILLLLIRVLIGRVLKSLQDFVQMMDETTLTDEPKKTAIESSDEIGLLHEHFHSLQIRLKQSQENLSQAQQQISHAERLASIGRLSAGIAHEINNPINGIKNCLYAINKHPNNELQTREYLQLIDEGIGQVSSIIQKLLNFGRRQTTSMGFVSINAQIENVIGLLSYNLREKEIELTLDLAKDLPPIRANGQLLQEVYLNLVMNSIDAVQKDSKISISTKYIGDGKIVSQVRDTGTGIREEDLPNIFDPFFTTKEIGRGTGLGLSVSLGIVQSFNGTIKVESEVGEYTTFTLTFPVMREDENPAG